MFYLCLVKGNMPDYCRKKVTRLLRIFISYIFIDLVKREDFGSECTSSCTLLILHFQSNFDTIFSNFRG